ncbi:MAG: hypothetical protein AAFW70_31430, partial [Cyanobacteria bacterium J06635_10]
TNNNSPLLTDSKEIATKFTNNNSPLLARGEGVGGGVSLSPRQAFFAEVETLPIKETINRTCAEIVCPYPPGIPVLMPGEVITRAALEYLQYIKEMGGFISNCADNSLYTLKVVKE